MATSNFKIYIVTDKAEELIPVDKDIQENFMNMYWARQVGNAASSILNDGVWKLLLFSLFFFFSFYYYLMKMTHFSLNIIILSYRQKTFHIIKCTSQKKTSLFACTCKLLVQKILSLSSSLPHTDKHLEPKFWLLE